MVSIDYKRCLFCLLRFFPPSFSPLILLVSFLPHSSLWRTRSPLFLYFSLILYQVFLRAHTHAGVAFGHQAALSHRLERTSNFPHRVPSFALQVSERSIYKFGEHSRGSNSAAASGGLRQSRVPARRALWVAAAGYGGARSGTRLATAGSCEELLSAGALRPPRPAAPPLGGSPRLFWQGLFA